MASFDHEKLDDFRIAIDFLALADDVVERLPRGRAVHADPFEGASISIPLNVAEGAGEFSPKDKKRFHRMAPRSATECTAIQDDCRRLNLAEEALLASGRDHLLRIVSMLTRLARRSDGAGTGTGTGTGTSTGRGSLNRKVPVTLLKSPREV